MDKNEYVTVFPSDKMAPPQIIEKKSRFIGYIAHVEKPDEASDFLNKIKTLHPQATHHVYAYVLRFDNLNRCSDDGEPARTAGVPILDVLIKNNVVDAMIVVVRYFGGTLLGTGGLVHAYSKAAMLALDESGIVTMAPSTQFKVIIDYSFYNSFISLLAEYSSDKPKVTFLDQVEVEFTLMTTLKDGFLRKFTEKCSAIYQCIETGESFAPVKSSTTISG